MYNRKQLKIETLHFQYNNQMYHPSSKMQKSKVQFIQETGTDFYPTDNDNDQSFSYQIQMQRQYVMRLKSQREKIEVLYCKYDVILNQLKQKDSLIKQKDQKIKEITNRTKSLQLACQQHSLIQEENRQFMNENVSLKQRLISLENQNSEILQQMKLKGCLLSDEKEELDQVNEHLQAKLRSLNTKIVTLEEEQRINLNSEKQKVEKLKIQHTSELSKINQDLCFYREEGIRKDQTTHMLKLDHEFLSQKLKDQEQNYSVYLRDLEAKIDKSQKEKKVQIKALKDIIEDKNTEIVTLQARISSYKKDLQVKDLEMQDLKIVLSEEKKMYDQDIYQLKSQMNNEKNSYREQFMYCQNHIDKLETKLNQSLKREKDLSERIRKFQLNDAAKRNLRQIQRQQMEKINKILSYQK